MVMLAPIPMESQSVWHASFSFFWSCRQWRGKYEGLSDVWDCSSTPRCSPLSCWNVSPRPWRLTEECPSPLLTFLVQPIPRNLGILKSSADFYGFLMMLMCVLRCFVFQLKYYVHCTLATYFFVTVQELNNALCFPVFRKPRLFKKKRKEIFWGNKFEVLLCYLCCEAHIILERCLCHGDRAPQSHLGQDRKSVV